MQVSRARTSPTSVDGNLVDMSAALNASGEKLHVAAANVLELLAGLTGFEGTPHDTAHDLKMALAMHLHLVQEFSVRVRTGAGESHHTARCGTSYAAYAAAADQQGDAPYSITVTPSEPNREALQFAHRALGIRGSLDDALKNDSLAIAIKRVARKPHFKPLPLLRPASGTDLKKFAANDRD
jgi:hypothetical protein